MSRFTTLLLFLALGCGDSTPVAATPDAGSGDDAAITAAALCITEVMAANSFTIVDDTGARPDWIEVHNPGDEAVDLAGYSITDDLDRPARHTFGDGLTIEAGGYLVLWADSASELGPDHLGFDLSKQGEVVGLFGPAGEPIAAVEFGAQVTDWSAQRVGDQWSAARDPTPGEQNSAAPLVTCPSGPEQMPAVPDPSGEIFTDDAVPELRLTLTAEAIASLEVSPFEYVRGAMTYRGRTYEPIGVRLKGQNSFQPLSRKAAFKLKFDEFIDGAEFLELEKLTLNNMPSDPTMMHERLAYRVFREAGVPASRSNHIQLYLNGEVYGLFANVENVDELMIARWFAEPDGPLFEGNDVEFLVDMVDVFQHEAGPDDRANILGLAEALRLQPATIALAAGDNHASMAQFRLFWAVSAAVGHFDAYPYHFDDFHLYDDPETGKLLFIPWGTDESFDSLGNVGWVGGLMATRCFEVEDCLLDWAYKVFDVVELMEQMDLVAEIDRIRVQIQPYVVQDTRKPYGPAQIAAARAQMRAFILERRATITEQFTPADE